MDINNYEIDIKHHAFRRAVVRKIYPDMIEATIKSGRIVKYGKNYVKFVKEYRNLTVICVGEVCGNKIKIITITKK